MAKLTSFSYRDILRQAYYINLRHKFLWFFGFFAAFLGVGGELEPFFKSFFNLSSTSDNVLSLRDLYQQGVFTVFANNIQSFFSTYPWQSILFILMTLVLTAVFIWLAIVSQIALFDAVSKISKKRETNYGEGYRAGNRHFGSVLLVNVILKGAIYVVLTIVGTTLLSWFLVKGNALGGLLFIILFFIVLVPISAVIAFIVRYAIAYIVIQRKKVGESMKLGWQLFKKNWLVSIEMALIIILIGIIVGLVIVVALGLTAVPFALIAIAALFFGSSTGVAVAVVVGTLAWFIIAGVLGGIYVSFQYTAWTLLFMKLVEDKAQSRLVRFFGKVGIGKS
ncbi:hypothetical protein IID19_03070 [Patescibacteria group bacterium]|nr:hypothetical protein [Patescibacteria group bacterium]